MSNLGRFLGYFGLSQNINKKKNNVIQENEEGVISDYYPELKLDLEDDEILKLTKQWEQKWVAWYEGEGRIKTRQENNKKYWLGKAESKLEDVLGSSFAKPLSNNLLFEALETYLPIATKQNPEPVVNGDGSPQGMELAKQMKKVLTDRADVLKLKLKLKQVARFWALYFVGVAKIAWSQKKNNITIKVIKTTDLILDPDAVIEENEYNGSFLGEYKKEKAKFIIDRFPRQKAFITSEVSGKMDTELKYVEWWTDEYICWRYKDKILDKIKNPHWNYDRQEKMPQVDEFGNQTETVNEIKGVNHFDVPKIPYMFLTVFNLGEHPMDDTNLIEQNIPQQDKINKWTDQITKNTENINGGWIVSRGRAGMTEEEVSYFVKALQKGGIASIPDGSPREAVEKFTGPSLPADLYNSLQDARNQLRSIFGTTGLTPQGIVNEQTVRGKIIVRGQDGDRIGGGVSEYIEQFADAVFNWFVQMAYVYYTDEIIVGGEKMRLNFTSDVKLQVSVKEGSLIPKDDLTKRNEAIDLFQAGALDPLTLFERLDFPDPKEAVQRLISWKSNPMALVGGQPVQQPALSAPQLAGQAGLPPLPSIEQMGQGTAGGIPMPPNMMQ